MASRPVVNLPECLKALQNVTEESSIEHIEVYVEQGFRHQDELEGRDGCGGQELQELDYFLSRAQLILAEKLAEKTR